MRVAILDYNDIILGSPTLTILEKIKRFRKRFCFLNVQKIVAVVVIIMIIYFSLQLAASEEHLRGSLEHCDREREELLERATSLEEDLQDARDEIR